MNFRQLGRYQVEGVIGRGAMGVVYLARDPVIGRKVALKTLAVPSDEDDAEEFRQRFLREAQAAGILSHPGIVAVHDAGVDEASGLSFIALEYVEGKSLKDLMRSGRTFTFSEVAALGAALAAALDYAHAKGVIHRDIKPANILVTTEGTVKITDFGVARLETSNLTATGQFIGTPSYMSPEQVTGGRLDGRSDLFSLGVVLFELVTGKRPYAGNSLTEVAYKIVHEAPPIPSQVRPGVPPAYNPILLKLMNKEPDRRYQRGSDVMRALDALRAVLAGLPSAATPVPAQAAPASAGRDTIPGSMTSAPTEVRSATTTPRRKPWKRDVEPRWAAAVLALAAIPTVLAITLIALAVDRGPYGGPLPGETARRHLLARSQRQAAEALDLGDTARARALLAVLWDQAPYSRKARALQQRIESVETHRQLALDRQEEADRLRTLGKEAYQTGRWREARDDFRRVLALVPDDDVASEYLELAEARMRTPRRVSAPPPAPTVAPTPVVAAVGESRLELYFNSPMGRGTIEILVGDEQVAEKRFDNTEKKLFGLIRRDRPTVVEDAYTVQSGPTTVTARLLDEDGNLLGQEKLPVDLAPGQRYQLKIEMEGKESVPRFSLRRWGR